MVFPRNCSFIFFSSFFLGEEDVSNESAEDLIPTVNIKALCTMVIDNFRSYLRIGNMCWLFAYLPISINFYLSPELPILPSGYLFA